MTRDSKKYLFDISDAIEHILDMHLAPISNAEEYANNLTIQRAVERELGIIGEAAYELQKMKVFFQGQDQVINRRNTLVHQYDVASPQQIWNYTQTELSALKAEVDKYLI